MRDALERELQQHAAALRGLARDLVGAGNADDVVQETALQALRTPPRRPGPLGAWLAGIVRHVAARHRRGERRRRAREQAVARAEVEAAHAGTDGADTLRFLTDAVLALPEPYRRALLARYLRDASPAEIAAETATPVGTVKTRLKRGLVLLRERLDAQQRARGADWRTMFVGAFGLSRVGRAGAAATAGVFVMTAGMKGVLGGVAAALVVVAWWFAGGIGLGAPTPKDARAGDPTSLAAQAEVRAGGQPPAAEPSVAPRAGQRREVGTTTQVTIRGRLVDEAGAPLAGLGVELRGRKAEAVGEKDFQREYGEWLRAGGRGPQALATTSATDGCFAFTAEPSPLAWGLYVRREAHVHSLDLWQRLDAQTLDLGDLVVPVTCTLRVRVVDVDGRPVPTPRVQLREDRGPEDRRPDAVQEDAHRLTSWPSPIRAATGGVTATVVPGRYRLDVPGRDVVRGNAIDVPPRATTFAHDLVVACATNPDTITGTVVDERGHPIAGVEVNAWHPHGSASFACTDPTGRFVLQRRDQPRGEVGLHFYADGHDWATEPRSLPWGAHDQRVVLRDLAAVEVRVVEDATGEPVTHYAVRTWRAPDDRGGGTRNDGGLRASGAHEQGVLRLTDVPRGRHLLLVEPHRWDLARSEVVPLEATPARVATVEVRVPRAADRTLLVRRADGTAVADANIAVADAAATAPEPLAVGARLVTSDHWDPTQLPAARILVQATATDDSGRASLHGPARRTLVARISGEGFAPFLVGPFQLDEEQPLVATLPVDGRLVARVGPPEFVRTLREVQDPAQSGQRPGFRLRRGTGTDAELVPPRGLPGALLDKDNSFAIAGVPAGDWQVALEAWDVMANGTRLVWSGGVPIEGANVTLRSGETTEVRLDLSAWLPGEITGIVRCNGMVVADATIGVDVARPHADDPRPSHTLVRVQTDAEGRFRYRGRGGVVRVAVDRGDVQRLEGGSQLVPSRATAALPANGTVEQDFDVTALPLRLRVLTSGGAPAPGVELLLVPDATAYWPRSLGPTGADGRTAGDVEPDTFTVQLAASRTPIGRVTVVDGQTPEVELRLPAEPRR